MAQKALYPMKTMRVTQDEYASYSHKGSPAQDNGGASPGTDDMTLAPYDGTIVRMRQDSSHETYFVSDAPVQQADGTVGILTTLFMHDNVLDVKVGQKRKRGEKIGDEGGFGYGRKDAFAHHVHIEVARGKQTTQTRNKQGTYVITNAISLHNAFFVAADTNILNGARHAWKRTTETLVAAKDAPGAPDAPTVPTTPGKPDAAKQLRLVITGKNCEYFSARDVDKTLGKLGVDKQYSVLEEYPQEVVIGALRGRWVRFAAGDGMEYFCLVLPDRAKLVEAVAEWKPTIGDIVRATAVLNVRTAPGEQRVRLATMSTGDTGEIRDIDGASCYIADKGWVVLAGIELVTRAV